eukprot:NODE_4131_length_1223_cov_44.270909_g3635_i0.p1 GENE.NODE_4131_length_1223_cov_44.270909_g3635_i0~~NODE_4131_length_1223_cov_44.270909_g3635_i0.p1  ORF type:complete len:287 (+),score=20.12 NODE_4131_length_1223_cov_44.270909_g3635_i0:55-861(+)
MDNLLTASHKQIEIQRQTILKSLIVDVIPAPRSNFIRNLSFFNRSDSNVNTRDRCVFNYVEPEILSKDLPFNLKYCWWHFEKFHLNYGRFAFYMLFFIFMCASFLLLYVLPFLEQPVTLIDRSITIGPPYIKTVSLNLRDFGSWRCSRFKISVEKSKPSNITIVASDDGTISVSRVDYSSLGNWYKYSTSITCNLEFPLMDTCRSLYVCFNGIGSTCPSIPQSGSKCLSPLVPSWLTVIAIVMGCIEVMLICIWYLHGRSLQYIGSYG